MKVYIMQHAIKVSWSIDINNKQQESIITVLDLHTSTHMHLMEQWLDIYSFSHHNCILNVKAQCWYLMWAACWTPFSSAASWDQHNKVGNELKP